MSGSLCPQGSQAKTLVCSCRGKNLRKVTAVDTAMNRPGRLKDVVSRGLPPLITTALEWEQIHTCVLDQSTLWCRKVAWAADLSLACTWDDKTGDYMTWQVCTDVQSWSLSKHRCSLRKPAAWGLFALESVFWRTQLGKLGSDGPRRLWIVRQSLYSSLWLCHQGQSLVTLCPEKHVAR